MIAHPRHLPGIFRFTLFLLFFALPLQAQNLQKSSFAYRPDLGAASPLLDVYHPLSPTRDVPVMVYVHGGAWVAGSRTSVHAKPAFFNDLGYIFVSVDYRLLPDVTVQQQLSDIDAALGWVADNITKLGGDPQNLSLMGHSAGAHLVTMTGVRPLPVARGLITSGALGRVISNDTRAYDIARIAASARGGKLPRLYERVFGNDPQNWRALSPQYQLTRQQTYPAFLLMYSGEGRGDTRAGFAADFATALRTAGGNARIFDGSTYSHRSINTGIGKDADINQTIKNFLRENS